MCMAAGSPRIGFMITALAKKMFGSRNDRLLKQYRKAVKRIG